MNGYLIYHPKRVVTNIDGNNIYHDSTFGNQCPYIWGNRYLHTFCHSTQMQPKVGHINFWVSGDTFPYFNHLFCDLVFIVSEILEWKNPNYISRIDPIVDSQEAFDDHYRWAFQHLFKKRARYTLKAEPMKSYQPQSKTRELLDVLPVLLEAEGLSLEELQTSIQAGFNSQPFMLSEHCVEQLSDWLYQHGQAKLRGVDLKRIRKANPSLGSVWTKHRACC